MTKVNFTIIFPDFLDFIFAKYTSPVPGEVWLFGTHKCEIISIGDKTLTVRTRLKPRIKVNLKDFIQYAERLDDLHL